MKKLSQRFLFITALAALLVGVSLVSVTEASHSWGNYHWSRSANPAALTVGDSVSSAWDGYLNAAIGDWNISSVVQLIKFPGLTNPKSCKPVSGRIEVCNSKYGNNGWLGLAQIWVSGPHIVQAVAKMNDTYFLKPYYNTPAWRQLVMCQEVAHDFGLDHQDEIFTNPNLGSCMDYTNNPSGPPSNEHPNTHDYEQLGIIYEHLDALLAASVATAGGSNGNGASNGSESHEWGNGIRRDSAGRANVYVRDLGNGKKVITHVLWVDSVEGK